MGNGTEIGRVRGLGSAHHGVGHWLLQRFTAVGNLVLVLFLAVGLALLPAYDFATVKEWVARPLTATALALMVVNTFSHARLGLQILMEDYVDAPGNRFALRLLLNFAAVAGIMFGLVSIARIAFSGAA